MKRIYQRGNARLQANLTPMIDVTFLLIVFFVLVSQIVEVESVDLSLPRLQDPASALPGEEQRAVINVVPGARGHALAYRLGARSFPTDSDGLARLSHDVTALLDRNPTLRINLRADRQTHYRWVQPVIETIADAADRVQPQPVTPRVNLVVAPEE